MVGTKIDPITLEIVRNALDSIVDQMTLTVMRTGRSPSTTESRDVTSAIAGPDGTIIGEGAGIIVHMGSIAASMPWVIKEFQGEFASGDIIISNDPYHGGAHLPDVIITRPLFVPDGPLVGFAAIMVHQRDVGGMFPGSMQTMCTEIFQEGLRLPPVKFYEGGRPNRAVHRLIETNVRTPEYVFGDLAGQMAGCLIAERQYLKLVERYGLETLQNCQREMADYTERVARQAIAALPEGTYEFADYLEYQAGEVPLRIGVKLIIHGDSMTVDLSDSSPQVKAGVNANAGAINGPVMEAVRAALQVDIPLNAGLQRCVRIVTKPGTFVHPVFPAPVAGRGATSRRVYDAVCGALAQVVPDRMAACSASEGGGGSAIYVYTAEGKLFTGGGGGSNGGFGARPNKDGFNAVVPIVTLLQDTPIEIAENMAPVRVEQYGFVPDSGGAGKYRGGLATVSESRLLEKEGTSYSRSERQQFLNWGLAGGKPGTPSMRILNPGPEEKICPPGDVAMRQNDLLRSLTAGAGGHGDPNERDPEAVRRDVRNGYVTMEGARRDYGVVITAEGTVDAEATERLRVRKSSDHQP